MFPRQHRIEMKPLIPCPSPWPDARVPGESCALGMGHGGPHACKLENGMWVEWNDRGEGWFTRD